MNNKNKTTYYDVIIVGAGIAGLFAATHIPKDKKVLLINKRETFKCNSFYAQGGIALSKDEKDIPLHTKDTLLAGAGICDEKAVEVLTKDSKQVIQELIQNGFNFDKDENGNLLYTKEAAHTTKRILHAGGDATGRYMHYFLLEQNPHPMLAHVRVVDLLIQDNRCYGVTVLENRELYNIYAKNVILASGGVGSLYEYHTNAPTISADMQGLCLTKGIALENMEMMQFHPTVFVNSNLAQKLLLTEALRGEGATIEDENGKRFLFDYDTRGELASRDIVSQSIFDYTAKTGSKAYLNMQNFDEIYFMHRFPNIYKKFHSLGYKVPNQKVPISPAFHYAIGGIKTNYYGKVPSISGLYAIGEVASTGVHGANRLASNSLLEGLVFSKRAVNHILNNSTINQKKTFLVRDSVMSYKDDKEKKNLLRKIMWEKVGVIRTQQGLNEALEQINALLNEKIGTLLQFRLLTAKEIILSALKRENSLGVHFIKTKESSDA